jgi:hypothetical protein
MCDLVRGDGGVEQVKGDHNEIRKSLTVVPIFEGDSGVSGFGGRGFDKRDNNTLEDFRSQLVGSLLLCGIESDATDMTGEPDDAGKALGELGEEEFAEDGIVPDAGDDIGGFLDVKPTLLHFAVGSHPGFALPGDEVADDLKSGRLSHHVTTPDALRFGYRNEERSEEKSKDLSSLEKLTEQPL